MKNTNGEVWVFAEQEEGKLSDVPFELLGKARELATKLGVKVGAVLMGEGVEPLAKPLFEAGADVVHLVDDAALKVYRNKAYRHAMVELVKEVNPQIVIFGATHMGRDLGPSVASALRCGLTADCTDLQIGDYEDKKTKEVFTNVLLAREEGRTGELVKHSAHLDGVEIPVEVVDIVRKVSSVNLKSSRIIVCGGAGVGSKENFRLLHDLAGVLGGAVGGSRAAVDLGYCEHERQIGQTGVTVRPALMISCGVSGAVQHLAGMQDSAKIIAINTDKDAPIFKVAHYGIVGDLNVVVPKLIKAIKNG